jgi:hypothetical protein
MVSNNLPIAGVSERDVGDMKTAGAVVGSAVGGITVAVTAGAQAESKTLTSINIETKYLRVFIFSPLSLVEMIFRTMAS